MVSLSRFVFAFFAFGMLWLAALAVLATAFSRDRRGKRSLRQRVSLWLSCSYLLLTVLAAPYALYVEPYWPEVERVELRSPKLSGPKKIRIVHLSDLHSDPETRLEDEIPRMVETLEPDLVVFTGDHVNSKEGIPTFRRCAKALADNYPTYAVKGNWEAWWFKDIDVFAGTGVVELDGRAVPVTVGGNRIWVAGVAVEHEHLIEKALVQRVQSSFRVASDARTRGRGRLRPPSVRHV